MADPIWSALGVADPPASFAIRPMPIAHREALLGGELVPQVARGVGPTPVPGGLFDEAVFGPLPRGPDGETRWARCPDELDVRQRPQAVRFGRLRLPFSVVHPFVHRVFRADDDLLGAVARGDLVLAPDGELVGDDARPELKRFGDAALSLAAAGRLELSADELIRDVPVLPAGLRTAFRGEDGRMRIANANYLYEHLMLRLARLARMTELGAPPILLVNEHKLILGAVECLFFDGVAERTDREGRWRMTAPETGEEPWIAGLVALLRSEPRWAAEVDRLVRDNPDNAFSQRWYPPAYHHRAVLEALCLEPVPLDDSGAVDETQRARAWLDREVRSFDDVYVEQLGPLWDGVLHDTHARHHIDVYATEPREGERWLITAGASTGATQRVELLLRVPAELDRSMTEHAMRWLQVLAHHSLAAEIRLALGEALDAGKPLAPGSPLRGFVFDDPPPGPWAAMARALPRAPRFVLAIGVDADMLGRLRAASDPRDPLASVREASGGVTAFPTTAGLAR